MGPYLSWEERAELAGRMILPYSVLVFLFLLNVVSVPYPLSAVFKAPFLVMAIYYWSVYRPTMLPPWFLFIIGLLFDILSGVPLGLNAGLFVLLRMAVVDQRRFLTGQAFMMVWLGFAIVNTIYHILQWLLFSLLAFTILPLNGLWIPIALGNVMFPVVAVMFNLTHKFLPTQSGKGKSALASQN